MRILFSGRIPYRQNYRDSPRYNQNYRNDFRRGSYRGNLRTNQNYRGQNYRGGYRRNYRDDNYERGRNSSRERQFSDNIRRNDRSGSSRSSADLVAKLIVHGTLNVQTTGLNLSAASWLCKILGQDVNSMHASPYQGVKLGLAKT